MVNSDRQDGLEIGQVVPDFSLPDYQANSVTLNDVLKHHGVLLTFIHGMWCPACIQTLYRLAQYADIYQAEGFGVAVIAHEQSGHLNVFKRSARPSVNYPLLADNEGTVRKRYHLTQIGAFFVIDQNKVVREKFLDVAHQGWPGHSRILTVMKRLRATP
jgi:peroxiredoxin